jgi:hypothetical protein
MNERYDNIGLFYTKGTSGNSEGLVIEKRLNLCQLCRNSVAARKITHIACGNWPAKVNPTATTPTCNRRAELWTLRRNCGVL